MKTYKRTFAVFIVIYRKESDYDIRTDRCQGKESYGRKVCS